MHLLENRGEEGGIILMRDSTLDVSDTAIKGSIAASYGGFMSAINSRFEIDVSIIEEGQSDHGCAFFVQGDL